MDDAFGVLQCLENDGCEIDRLNELYNMVEAALNLATEIYDNYSS